MDAGYSEQYARKGAIQKSDTWNELLEQELPDCLLTRVHKEGLEATKKDGVYTVDDYGVRHRYLDSAYKLKKRYDNTITIKGKISQLSTEEVEDAIAREVSEALGAIAGASQEGNE